MSFYLYRRGPFWADENDTRYTWLEDGPTFMNEETGEIVVLIEIISDDKVLVG